MTLHIIATVQSTEKIDNVAQIAAATPLDTNPANDRAVASLQAPRTADLQLTSNANVASTNPGGAITYTLTVKNLGGDPAYGVNVHQVSQSFPALTPFAFTPSKGLYTPAPGIWNVWGLSIGQPATLSFTVMAPNFGGNLLNPETAATNAAAVPSDGI